MKRRFVCVALAAACATHPKAPQASAAPMRLEARVDARKAHAVAVEEHFVHAGTEKIALPDETLRGITRIEIDRGGDWVPLDRQKLEARECIDDCRVRYTVDLGNVERSFEGVVAVGASTFVAPSSSWLARPWPAREGAFDITIEGAMNAPRAAFESVSFATGLRRASPENATHFVLPTNDFAEGSFAAFGDLRHRLIDVGGGGAPSSETIEVVIVGDATLTLTDDEVASWVHEDADCVAQLYGKFPVPRASVFIVPIEGATRVVFGKVLSLGGASIIALTGTDFPSVDGAARTPEARTKARHRDWVLVHEMVHLGFPTMYGVRWLTEGLATYYEPVLRTRAGWHTREWLWDDFAQSMPRGIPPEGAELALSKRDSIDDAYWGGALFVMMVDVGIRQATSNKKSFDDVLRAVLGQGGDATVVWTMAQLTEAARKETGRNVFGDLVARYADKGERIDFPAFFRSLGITRDGALVLDDSAPLAAIRRSIETGK